MSFVVTSDLHLTDLPRDEYRWALFDHLRDTARRRDAQALFILGDLTDRKDYHSARLVNRLASALVDMPCRVVVLKGNHDYADAGTPFFGFLDHVPNVLFASTITSVKVDGRVMLLVPHTRQPDVDWEALQTADIAGAHYVFTHQTFDGANSETGQRLSGLPAGVFSDARKGRVLSGDIHTPQVVGPVEYVGAPYHVHFGDSYTPRVLAFDARDRRTELNYPFPAKHMAHVNSAAELAKYPWHAGDHAKVVVTVLREQVEHAADIRRDVQAQADKAGVQLFGVEVHVAKEVSPRARRNMVAGRPAARTAAQELDVFCELNDLPAAVRQAGAELLEEQSHV